MKPKLHLIPTPLGGENPRDVLPAPLFEVIGSLKLFFVEELRTARRFLSKAGLKGEIDNLTLYELNEHTAREQIESYVKLLTEQEGGLISEAGLPAVADPGALLVELAHQHDIEVIPYVGPSSLMMALMASGMNGQHFTFTGYLPVKRQERRARIEQLEKISHRLQQTQIIIETPYRNDSLMEDLITCCKETTRICIAADLTLPQQYVRTRTVAGWRKLPVTIGKRPCVFVLQA